jgi:uncharacterized protein (DUF433 family)
MSREVTVKTREKPQQKRKPIRSGNGKKQTPVARNGKRGATQKSAAKKLVLEMYGGEPYEYYPLGKYVVAAPGVCGGRPTFKYTRIDTRHALNLVAGGWRIEDIVAEWWEGRVSAEAIREAIQLASDSLDKHYTAS